MLDHIKKVSQARKLLNKICLPGRRRGDRSCSHQDWTLERLDRNRFGHWPGDGGTCLETKKIFSRNVIGLIKFKIHQLNQQILSHTKKEKGTNQTFIT